VPGASYLASCVWLSTCHPVLTTHHPAPPRTTPHHTAPHIPRHHIRTPDATNATTLILATGILQSFGAGIVIYDALINIIHPHCIAERFRRASAVAQAGQVASLWLGVAVMSIIELWA
jgi:hypothetical protein